MASNGSEENANFPAVGRTVPTRTYEAIVRPHEPWKAVVSEPSIMPLSELDKRLEYSKFTEYVKRTHESWSPQNRTAEAEAIRNDVEGLASKLVESLSRRYRMFAGCKLLKTGSTYEGVKIGPSDEFDFMIEVPALQDGNVIQIKVPGLESFPYKAKIIDPDFLSDVHPQITRELSGEFEVNFWTRLRKIILEFVSGYFRGNKSWEVIQDPHPQQEGFTFDVRQGEGNSQKSYVKRKVVQNLPEYMQDLTWAAKHHAATTFALKWIGEEYSSQEVSIDFCVAIPMLANPMDYRDLYYKTEISQGIEAEFLPCHVLLLTKFFCRLSFSVEEMRIMKRYPYPQGQNICMRLLKYLRDSELPQDKDPKTNELLQKMPSYWIKTVLYGLYKKYPDACSWKEKQLALRVLEALDILADACARIDLPNHFIPSYNLLSPSKPSRELAVKLRKIQAMFLKP